MNIELVRPDNSATLAPLSCRHRLADIPLANIPYAKRLEQLLENFLPDWQGWWREDCFPSVELLRQVAQIRDRVVIVDADNVTQAELSCRECVTETVQMVTLDSASLSVRYPWDILALNEGLIAALTGNKIFGRISEQVVIDGKLQLGHGSVLLPGVYIEGNVVIGENCKIGPNCYIRGNSSIGDNCHIGQAVEIKNSLLMNNVSAGHLSYIGDSIICPGTNFGAGTITANFRHDGKNHRSMVDGELLDTGRRKFGTVIGDNVHTGIHTAIYPGRKLWPECSTRPGTVVQHDITD